MKKYSGGQIALHWLVLLLIVIAYAAMEFRDIFPKILSVVTGWQ